METDVREDAEIEKGGVCIYIYIILVNLFIGEQKWGDWSGCL